MLGPLVLVSSSILFLAQGPAPATGPAPAPSATPASAPAVTAAPATAPAAGPAATQPIPPAGGPAPAPAAQPAPNPLSTLIPLLPIPILFYFLMIRPQQQQEKKRKQMVNTAGKNARVVTSGGIYGTVVSSDPETDTVLLRLGSDPGVKVEFSRAAIVRVLDAAGDKPKAES